MREVRVWSLADILVSLAQVPMMPFVLVKWGLESTCRVDGRVRIAVR
jgi:hypothetical protein